MTIDEELSLLEDQVRRLKVEYDVYFGGGSKKPPTEIEWKVKNLLRKFADGNRMSYGQRFRFTTDGQYGRALAGKAVRRRAADAAGGAGNHNCMHSWVL